MNDNKEISNINNLAISEHHRTLINQQLEILDELESTALKHLKVLDPEGTLRKGPSNNLKKWLGVGLLNLQNDKNEILNLKNTLEKSLLDFFNILEIIQSKLHPETFNDEAILQQKAMQQAIAIFICKNFIPLMDFESKTIIINDRGNVFYYFVEFLKSNDFSSVELFKTAVQGYEWSALDLGDIFLKIFNAATLSMTLRNTALEIVVAISPRKIVAEYSQFWRGTELGYESKAQSMLLSSSDLQELRRTLIEANIQEFQFTGFAPIQLWQENLHRRQLELAELFRGTNIQKVTITKTFSDGPEALLIPIIDNNRWQAQIRKEEFPALQHLAARKINRRPEIFLEEKYNQLISPDLKQKLESNELAERAERQKFAAEFWNSHSKELHNIFAKNNTDRLAPILESFQSQNESHADNTVSEQLKNSEAFLYSPETLLDSEHLPSIPPSIRSVLAEGLNKLKLDRQTFVSKTWKTEQKKISLQKFVCEFWKIHYLELRDIFKPQINEPLSPILEAFCFKKTFSSSEVASIIERFCNKDLFLYSIEILLDKQHASLLTEKMQNEIADWLSTYFHIHKENGSHKIDGRKFMSHFWHDAPKQTSLDNAASSPKSQDINEASFFPARLHENAINIVVEELDAITVDRSNFFTPS